MRLSPTCGESKGYFELNLNCKTNSSPSYNVPSGPLMWMFQLCVSKCVHVCVCVSKCVHVCVCEQVCMCVCV